MDGHDAFFGEVSKGWSPGKVAAVYRAGSSHGGTLATEWGNSKMIAHRNGKHFAEMTREGVSRGDASFAIHNGRRNAAEAREMLSTGKRYGKRKFVAPGAAHRPGQLRPLP
jgi:hypothetical protein